jgi:hypothetical protein
LYVKLLLLLVWLGFMLVAAAAATQAMLEIFSELRAAG